MARYPIPQTRLARLLSLSFAIFGTPPFVFGLFEYFWIYQNPVYANVSVDHPIAIQLRSETAYVSPTIAYFDSIAPYLMWIAIGSGFALYFHARSVSRP